MTPTKPKSKNARLLTSFVKYCKKHPELRFWQALREWSERVVLVSWVVTLDFKNGLLTGIDDKARDTYYSNKRNGL